MGNNGLIVAVDVDPIRLDETRQNLQRLGVRCVDARCGDMTDPEFVASLGVFDRVLSTRRAATSVYCVTIRK